MATAAAEAPAGGGKKKLIIIVAAVLILAIVGVGVLLLMKKKASADDEDGGDTAPAPAAHAKSDKPPVFVPVEAFTVNLADKEVDRFAQIGVTLAVGDEKAAEEVKAYMPAIRSNILMVLSHKTSADLLSPEGKDKLAKEILREASRGMGIEMDDEDDDDAGSSNPPKKKKKKHHAVESPISDVLFSTFIVQ